MANGALPGCHKLSNKRLTEKLVPSLCAKTPSTPFVRLEIGLQALELKFLKEDKF